MDPRGTRWYWFILWLAKRAFWLLGGYRVSGIERVPPEGPVIIAPNHLSFLDPPLAACAQPRCLFFMAKEELFKVPMLGTLIRSVRAFPVRRGDNDTEAIRKAIEVLRAGCALLVFPEGTRGDGTALGAISPGIAMLAKRSNAVVVPVGMNGTQKAWPRGQKFPKRARMRVQIGQPFKYSEIATESEEKSNREKFASELATRIADACAQVGLEVTVSPSNQRKQSCDPADIAIATTSPDSA